MCDQAPTHGHRFWSGALTRVATLHVHEFERLGIVVYLERSREVEEDLLSSQSTPAHKLVAKLLDVRLSFNHIQRESIWLMAADLLILCHLAIDHGLLLRVHHDERQSYLIVCRWRRRPTHLLVSVPANQLLERDLLLYLPTGTNTTTPSHGMLCHVAFCTGTARVAGLRPSPPHQILQVLSFPFHALPSRIEVHLQSRPCERTVHGHT